MIDQLYAELVLIANSPPVSGEIGWASLGVDKTAPSPPPWRARAPGEAPPSHAQPYVASWSHGRDTLRISGVDIRNRLV
jgi:hypothetical protein